MMLWYLDSVIVMYYFDDVGVFRTRADAYLSGLAANGHLTALSELVRLEYRVKPLKNNDHARLAIFDSYFRQPSTIVVPMSTPVFDRAAEIRAAHNYKLADALHLAAATEGGCDRFLTNDHRLAGFPGMVVEVLP